MRARALTAGKVLYMAVPRLADDLPFYLLDPEHLAMYPWEAATKEGAAKAERAGWLWSGHGSPAIIWLSGCRARLPARTTASTPPATSTIDLSTVMPVQQAPQEAANYGELAAAR